MRLLPPALGATLLAFPAAAQTLPPENGLPLSQIIASLEKAQPVIDVEWDDDDYRDIEFVKPSNRRAGVRIDPLTGDQWTRRRRRPVLGRPRGHLTRTPG
jgi:hypothetical protein